MKNAKSILHNHIRHVPCAKCAIRYFYAPIENKYFSNFIRDFKKTAAKKKSLKNDMGVNMKIAILNANSTYGKPIVTEALKRGMDVTVILRNENETEATKVITKEIPDLTTEDLAPFDAIIDASGLWSKEYLPRHYDNVLRLCDLISGTDKKFLIVGGAGTTLNNSDIEKWLGTGTDHEIDLNTGKARTSWFGANAILEDLIVNSAADYAVEALGSQYATMDSLYAALRKRTDVQWIFMEPSCELNVALLSGSVNMPYNNYAADMLDELEHGMFFQHKIGTTC